MEHLEKLELACARLRILKKWVGGKRNEASMEEVSQKVLGQCYTMKANSVVEKINQRNTFLEVIFRDLIPQYYPIEMLITSLYQVIAEVFYPKEEF